MTTAAHDSSSPLLGKRRIDAILENKENIAIKRQGRVAALLDEFDIEGMHPIGGGVACVGRLLLCMWMAVEARCEALKAHAAELATSFRNQLSIELIKIPKAIREMPMKEFVEKYGGDLNVYIEEGIKKRAQSIEHIPQPPQTPNKDVSGKTNFPLGPPPIDINVWLSSGQAPQIKWMALKCAQRSK